MTPDLFHSHNHPERMIRKMEQYVEKRQLCDVTIVVGTKRIPAHRLVLSAASDYFAAMFMNDVKEATMEEIRMKDVDPDAMVAIVNYAYTGNLVLKFPYDLLMLMIFVTACVRCFDLLRSEGGEGGLVRNHFKTMVTN